MKTQLFSAQFEFYPPNITTLSLKQEYDAAWNDRSFLQNISNDERTRRESILYPCHGPWMDAEDAFWRFQQSNGIKWRPIAKALGRSEQACRLRKQHFNPTPEVLAARAKAARERAEGRRVPRKKKTMKLKKATKSKKTTKSKETTKSKKTTKAKKTPRRDSKIPSPPVESIKQEVELPQDQDYHEEESESDSGPDFSISDILNKKKKKEEEEEEKRNPDTDETPSPAPSTSQDPPRRSKLSQEWEEEFASRFEEFYIVEDYEGVREFPPPPVVPKPKRRGKFNKERDAPAKVHDDRRWRGLKEGEEVWDLEEVLRAEEGGGGN